MAKIVSLVKKYLKEKRGDPLNVTVPEAELLHDFATWVDKQSAQQVRAADIDPLCPECHCELHLTTAGDHVCRNEACGSYR